MEGFIDFLDNNYTIDSITMKIKKNNNDDIFRIIESFETILFYNSDEFIKAYELFYSSSHTIDTIYFTLNNASIKYYVQFKKLIFSTKDISTIDKIYNASKNLNIKDILDISFCN